MVPAVMEVCPELFCPEERGVVTTTPAAAAAAADTGMLRADAGTDIDMDGRSEVCMYMYHFDFFFGWAIFLVRRIIGS